MPEIPISPAWGCLKEAYAQFAEFPKQRGGFREFELSEAARQMGIEVGGQLHTAKTDARLACELMRKMAEEEDLPLEQRSCYDEQRYSEAKDPTDKTGQVGDSTNSGKRSSLAGRRFEVVNLENPRRKDTHGWRAYEWALSQPNRIFTGEDFRAAGHGFNHLHWDLDRGNYKMLPD